MKIYKCQKYYHDLGAVLSWHSSKRDAHRARTAFLKEGGDNATTGPSFVEQVDIPTTRDGLIRWLNVHFDRDNE